MYKYKSSRNFLIKRNLKLFKEEYNWDYKFLKSPYNKLKTVFNLEVAAVLLFFVSNTNLKANHVTLFGVIWVYIGTVLISINNNFWVLFGLMIYFTKLIPDYVDGTLAHLKKEQSKEGFELDLWAGEINKLGVITGTLLYIFNITNQNIYLFILIIILILNIIDPRKHLSRTKFGVSKYNKKLKSHTQIVKKNESLIFTFLKFLNYDGRTNYSDFVILLILLDIFYQINLILIYLPWLWLVLSCLILIRAKYLVFFKRNRKI